MLSYIFGGLVIAALFALIRSLRYIHILVTNIINTTVSSMLQFSLLFHVPKYSCFIVIVITHSAYHKLYIDLS